MSNPWHRLRGLTGTGPEPIELGARMTAAEVEAATAPPAPTGSMSVWTGTAADPTTASDNTLGSEAAFWSALSSEPSPEQLGSRGVKPYGAAPKTDARDGVCWLVCEDGDESRRIVTFSPVFDAAGNLIALAAPPD